MIEDRIEMDYFGDGMRIFLDYIARQIRGNPKYKPHPIIRAFECAFEGIENLKDEETVMGVSQEGSSEDIHEPYIVVLKKKKDGIEVKEILNAKIGKTLPLDVMIQLFRLQIQLDKIEGPEVTTKQAVCALNFVFPGDKFYLLGNRWREARDEFKRLLMEGKIHLPTESKMAEALMRVRYDTPWEDYPNNVRALIGGACASLFGLKGGTVVVTTPEVFKIEKYKVFDMASEFLFGKVSEYLNPTEKET